MDKKLKKGEIINVQAYKHNGKLYRQWNGAKVIEASTHHTVLLMFKTKVLEADGTNWIVREPMLWFFDHKEFYNTTGLIRKSGVFFYTNIASPPVIEENTIKFIDYDLEIKAYHKQRVKIVDKKEFFTNIKKYNYSEKLVKELKETVEHVKFLIEEGAGYFDVNVINTFLEDLYYTKQLSIKLTKGYDYKNKKK